MIKYFTADNNIYKLIDEDPEYYTWWVFDYKIREWHYGSRVVKRYNIIELIHENFKPITEAEAFLEVL